jgi:hypothetical protein
MFLANGIASENRHMTQAIIIIMIDNKMIVIINSQVPVESDELEPCEFKFFFFAFVLG